MEETYRQESVWGKESKVPGEKEEEESNVVINKDTSEENTMVETKMVNPLASLVK